MLTVAFGESTMSRTQVQLWYNRFKEGREYVNGDTRPVLPSTSTTDENIEAVMIMIMITIREVADDVGIAFGSCQAILTNVLGMKRAAEKIVQKLLKMLTMFNDVPDLLKKIITGDESKVYGYDIETKVPVITLFCYD